MDIDNQQISRSRGVTAFGFDSYQQIYSQYNSSFTFVSSLIPYSGSVNFPVKEAIDSCWTSGNIFKSDRNSGTVIKTGFANETLASLSVTNPYSLSVIQSVVPLADDNPVDDSCLGCWIVDGTSVYRTDANLNIEVEITSLSSPTLVCVNHSNSGCYVVDETLGLFSFDFYGDLISIGNFTDDHVIGVLSNSEGNLFLLTEGDLYKFSNNNGNLIVGVTFNLTSYLTSQIHIGSFDIDTSTDYIYTGSGDNTTIRVVKFDSSGNHLGTLNSSGDFPYIVKVSQHPSSDTFYMVSDDNKIQFVESSSSSSSEMYSDPSSSSSDSSDGYSESSSTSSEGYSESSSSSSFGFSSSSSSSSSFGFSSSSSSSSSEGYSESSSESADPCYAFEKNGFTSYWNLDSDFNDSFGTNNLTGVGTPTHITGKNNDGLSLDGSTQYLELTGNTSLNPSSGKIAFSCWFKTDKDVWDGNNQYVVSKMAAFGERSYQLELSQDATDYDITFAIRQTDDTIVFVGGSGFIGHTVVTAGVWYHVVCIADGSDVSIYVNGVEEGTDSYDGTIKTGTTDFFIGGRSGATDYFDGVIDEVAIWLDPTFTGSVDRQRFVNGLYNNGDGHFDFETCLSSESSSSSEGYSSSSSEGYSESSSSESTEQVCLNTKLLMHFDGPDGSTNFKDESDSQHAISILTGDPKIVTSTSKFGGASGEFDGNDTLTIPDSTDWDFGTGDFTIDFWFKNSSGGNLQTIISHHDDANNFWLVRIQRIGPNIVDFVSEIGGTPIQVFSVNKYTDDVWAHFAVVRNSGSVMIFIDGNKVASNVVNGHDLTGFSAPIEIGSWNGSDIFTGNIDELRVLKGLAIANLSDTTIDVPTSQYNCPNESSSSSEGYSSESSSSSENNSESSSSSNDIVCNCDGNTDPQVKITVSWTDTDTNKNLFGCAWENGEEKLVCPNIYAITDNTSFAGSSVQTEAWNIFSDINNRFSLGAKYHRDNTTFGTFGYKKIVFQNSQNSFGWFKEQERPFVGSPINNVETTSNISTKTHQSGVNAFLFWAPDGRIDDSNFGQLTTTDGTTIKWEKKVTTESGRKRWKIDGGGTV